MTRAYYSNSLEHFLEEDENTILGLLARQNPYSLDDLQRNAWLVEINTLKETFPPGYGGHIAFEYSIPRMGSRVDVVYLAQGIIFLLEFKVGAKQYDRNAILQVTDYALDLKNFHKESHDRPIVPILIATNAPARPLTWLEMKEGIFEVLCCNKRNLSQAIDLALSHNAAKDFPATEWMNSVYTPTPTIIEAAQTLYRRHGVLDISRRDASAINLKETTEAINRIIEHSKRHHRKSICFVTGVPGAGKTLAGLNIANERHRFDESEHAVFLSGNQPLVQVLQEALACDEYERQQKTNKITKKDALRNAKAFIQMIYHFRDDALASTLAPLEKVTIFDEAQRAWTEKQLTHFMSQKRGRDNFSMSEPAFLIDTMDRHEDWAVIVCLVGGGQEIHTGEAGLPEWFRALQSRYSDWDIYLSSKITDSEYVRDHTINSLLGDLPYVFEDDLHLSVSLRSFRSENVARFVKALLDVDVALAGSLYRATHRDYPILMTRDLCTAKEWVRGVARGTERYGMTASSGAMRLRADGIWIENKINAVNWFLNGSDDVRSSYYLEETATEFEIQGLELDWSIVCWDADLRFMDGRFQYHRFRGTKWQMIHKEDDRLYLKNTYRVLLTRARQGFIIYIPRGEKRDPTRSPVLYEGIYRYLQDIGVQEI